MASSYVKDKHRLISMTARDVAICIMIIIMLNILIEIYIFQSIFNYKTLKYSLVLASWDKLELAKGQMENCLE